MSNTGTHSGYSFNNYLSTKDNIIRILDMYPPAGPDFEAGMGVSQNKLFYFFHLYDFF